ncbi:MAG: lytic transglycosylase protein [Burkholderiaceae bacterium]|nr:lytic transglycosylase protein [Burkholderiaceae bacterium]
MFDHSLREQAYAAPSNSNQPAQTRGSRAGGIVTAVYHALSALGVSALCVLAVMFVKPDLADHLISMSPFVSKATVEQNAELTRLSSMVSAPAAVAASASAKPAAVAAEDAKPYIGNERQQRWVTSWLAKRYRVASDAANMLVSAAYTTAVETKLDPLLILAVIAVESRFNPFAESPMGAQGLMQVMSKVHKDRFDDHGGVKAALNPVANIKVGSQILKEYVERGGSVEAGLKGYVGAAALDTDYGYGAKVLSEYRKLKEVASGKKVPTATTTANAAPRKARVVPAAGQASATPSAERDTLAVADEAPTTQL